MTAGEQVGGKGGAWWAEGERETRGERCLACEPPSVREKTASDCLGIHSVSVCSDTREEVINGEVPVPMSHLGVILRDE